MAELERLARFLGPSPLATEPVLVAHGQLPGAPDAQLAARCQALRAEFDLPDDVRSGAPADLAFDTVARLARRFLNLRRGLVTVCGHQGGAEPIVWVSYHVAPLGWQALNLAWSAVAHGLADSDEWRERLAGFSERCERRHPDYQARVLMIGARAAGLPVLEVSGPGRVWQFGWGARRQWFFETSSDGDGAIGLRIAATKPVTTAALGALGVPVPRHVQVADPSGLAEAIEEIGFPCVLKPQDRGGGKGVTTGIHTAEDARVAFDHARQQSAAPILLERQATGIDYRILVVDGEVRAVIERTPPRVTGDGRRTVRELIEALNRTRPGGMQQGMYLVPVTIGEPVVEMLAAQGATLETRPEDGQVLKLLPMPNRSTGGDCRDVLDKTHPRVKEVSIRVAAALGLRCTGLDIVTPDITKPLEKAGGVVLEANLTPGSGPMIAAGAGEAEVGRMILGLAPGRIPAALIICAAPRQPTLARALLDAIPDPGLRIAARNRVLDRTGALPFEGPQPGASVRAALMDRTASSVVILQTPEELRRAGLFVDRVDLALCDEAELGPDWAQCVAAHSARMEDIGDDEAMAQAVRGVLDARA